MKTLSYLGFVLLFLLLLIPSPSMAKRKAPAEVEPVVYKDMKILALHWHSDRGAKYIEARDIKTDAKLWELKVYSVSFDPKKERDVQDVFIKSMILEGDTLIVENEKKEKYLVDLIKRSVKKAPSKP